MSEIKFNVLENFVPLWENNPDKRYFILMGGRGAGRSTASSQFAVTQLPLEAYFRCAIMRAVHADIRHSIWKEINDRIDEQGVRDSFSIRDNDMAIEYGRNSIQAHGFKSSSGALTAKLKSLAQYNAVLIEEAEEVSEQDFMTLDDTLRTVYGNIKIILNLNPPPKSHWIIQRFFDLEPSEVDGFYTPVLKKEIDDTVFIGCNYKINQKNLDKNTIKRYEQYKQTKPDYYYNMIQGLVPDVVRGKIYTGWQQIEAIPQEARLLGFGEDFGWYPDPACLVAIYYWNGSLIIDELAYGNYLTNDFLASRMKEVGNAPCGADSAEPKSIEEQRMYGANVIPAEKGSGSIEYGIKFVSQKKIYVTKRSKNVWESYENYCWKEDRDGNSIGTPDHRFSHCMDAIRYGVTTVTEAIVDDEEELSLYA